MSNMPFLMAVIAMASITGCATLGFGPKYGSIKSDIAPLPEEKSRMVFYRPQDLLVAWRLVILLDWKTVGRGRSGSVFYVDVDPGKHLVAIPVPMYPAVTTEDITISKSETIYVKYYYPGFKPVVEFVDSEQAMAEIDELEFLADPNK
jgi:hypothetical protein